MNDHHYDVQIDEIQCEFNVGQEKDRPNTSHFKVFTVRKHLRPVMNLIIDCLCWNQIKSCKFNQIADHCHGVCWKLDAFKHGHMDHNLLIVEHAPELT